MKTNRRPPFRLFQSIAEAFRNHPPDVPPERVLSVVADALLPLLEGARDVAGFITSASPTELTPAGREAATVGLWETFSSALPGEVGLRALALACGEPLAGWCRAGCPAGKLDDYLNSGPRAPEGQVHV